MIARPWAGFVVVSGPPASGKTTLARSLAPELGLPLLSKDTIKHGLMVVLPVPDIETSRLLGRASVAALLAVAKDIGCGVLEAPWQRSAATPLLLELPAPVVEVFCRCDRVTAAARFASRIASQGPGHFAADRTEDELGNDEVSRPVAGGWPVIEVDTNRPVDVAVLVAELREAQAP